MTSIETLLLDLIKIPSTTGQEKEIGNFIISKLNGFSVKKQHIDNERFNVIATKGSSRRWLVAHMDTVPGNVACMVTETDIYGRGACDNKQSVAASIIVGNQSKDINLLFTVGEESDFCGAKKAQELGINPSLTIIQEPTSFQIITGQRGVVSFILRTTGKAQHSSLDNNKSAIHKLIAILSSLQKENWTAFNVGKITGGIAENIVADRAEATVVIRPHDKREYDLLLKRLDSLEVEVIVKNSLLPYKSNLNFPENIAKHFSEMSFFKNAIQFGAGNIQNAHTNNEHISRSEINVLPEKLLKLLYN